ncbi:hypothetical protein [Chromatium okenii]|uniref:hypothetical protein n=1 Tax=Chromatium okenii TaxID=61644 RepID=UPI0026F0259E|nr:hypothetical protein [Chromatium okenii]MBV5309805.1 hypothetical protein [Chromatium okenii]
MAAIEFGAGGACARVKPDWLNVPAAPAVVTTAPRARIIAFCSELESAVTQWQHDYLDCDVELIHHHFNTQHCDKHGIDVALSVGRHAVERAKLAQRNILITGTFSNSTIKKPLAHGDCFSGDVYHQLHHGNFELAALVGMTIASAQLGIAIRIHGTSAALVRDIAIQLQQ